MPTSPSKCAKSTKVRGKTVSTRAVQKGTEYQTTMIRLYGNKLNWPFKNKHADLVKQKNRSTNKTKEVKLWCLKDGEEEQIMLH